MNENSMVGIYRSIMQKEKTNRLIMPESHFIGGNYWLLKTTHQNRGIGIHVFKSIN